MSFPPPATVRKPSITTSMSRKSPSFGGQGSVIRSWLLDLTGEALVVDPALTAHDGRVADSGEGRWALQTAIATETAAPLLAQALFQRFTSRDQASYGNRLLSAMRDGFGGHGPSSRR